MLIYKFKYFVAESQTPGGLNWQGVNELRKYGLTDKNHMNKICNELFQELNSNKL